MKLSLSVSDGNLYVGVITLLSIKSFPESLFGIVKNGERRRRTLCTRV